MTNLLYELLYVLSVSVGLLSLLSEKLIGKETELIAVVLQIVVSCVFVFFKKSKWTVRIILISVIVVLIISGVLLSANETIAGLIRDNADYIWLLGIGAFAFFIGEMMCLSAVVRVIISVASFSWMIICLLFGYSIEKLFVVMAFLIILFTLSELTQARWKKLGQTTRQGHLVFVSPFILLTILLVYVSPAPDKPYDWALAKSIYEFMSGTIENIIDDISSLFSDEETTNPAEAKIGFSERGDITGSIGGGNKKAMEITGLSSYVDQIRFAGKTFTDFDGKTWADNDHSDAHATLMDTISLCASLSEYTDRDNDFARRSYINIKYDSLTTDHVFLPQKSLPMKWGLQTKSYREEGGNVLWPDIHSEGSMYAISYYLLNTDNPIINDYLSAGKVPSEQSYDVMEKRLNTDRLNGCTYSDYLTYLDHVKDAYTAAPVLSKKLRERMDSVYAGAKTDYEKMKRLEAMLRQYEYSLSPGPLPERVNNAGTFLDYLLLESKQGFCAHYATAFVLLARAEGLPARYVQGYMANTGGKTSVIVKNADAHAWPEVYFEGAGWIAFEPTPSLNEGHSYWKTASEKESLKPFETESVVIVTDRDGASIFSNIQIKWYMIVIPVIIGILFVILSFVFGHLISAARFKKMKPEEKLTATCRQCFRILRLYGLEIQTHETLYEYRCRLGEAGIKDNSFLEYFERFLYNEELAEGAQVRAEEAKKNLLLKLKKKSMRRYIRYYLGFK